MHGTLLALTLAAYLLAPSSLLSRLWHLASGPAKAPASSALQKEGPGWDPSGLTAAATPAAMRPRVQVMRKNPISSPVSRAAMLARSASSDASVKPPN